MSYLIPLRRVCRTALMCTLPNRRAPSNPAHPARTLDEQCSFCGLHEMTYRLWLAANDVSCCHLWFVEGGFLARTAKTARKSTVIMVRSSTVAPGLSNLRRKFDIAFPICRSTFCEGFWPGVRNWSMTAWTLATPVYRKSSCCNSSK